VLVLDASAAVATVINQQPEAPQLLWRLARADSLHAPQLLDLEVLQVLRRYTLQGKLAEKAAQRALELLADLRVSRYAHLPLLGRIWELRANVTAYDAAYIALAEALGAPLLTLDARLARAPGHRARVEVIG
jgi:predicted nucleic acid-binding protein